MLIVMLIIVSGLPGSGKSYFASRLARHLGATYLSSDALRKDLINEPLYSLEEKERVYVNLMTKASEALRAGRSVVLDATFHTTARRQNVAQLGAESGVSPHWIEVFAAEPIIRARLAKKRPDSDADTAVYEKIMRESEPLSEDHLRLESTQSNLADMIEKALRYLGL